MEVIEFNLKTDYIELNRLLKATGIIQSGGEIGSLLELHAVKVNDEIEKRKRRKIRPGDTVNVASKTVSVLKP
jgi:ribosome-associated protein